MNIKINLKIVDGNQIEIVFPIYFCFTILLFEPGLINCSLRNTLCLPDDVAELGETLVDGGPLLEAVSGCARGVGALRARQVHQVDVRGTRVAFARPAHQHLSRALW